MIAIALLTTLAWIVALFYYRLGHSSKDAYKNTWGWKIVALVLLQFAIGLLVFRFLSKVDLPSVSPEDGAPTGKLSDIQWFIIAALSVFIWIVLKTEIADVLSRFWKKSTYWEFGARFLVAFTLTTLILNQVFIHNVILNNLFVLFIVVLALEFSIRFTKPAFMALLGAIMLADIYFVWMAASATATAVGQSWYVKMFHSEFMNHFPFPIGFRWGGHLLGNGDIFFMTMTVMYARRVWNLKAAVVAGIAMTLPILLLPLAAHLLSAPPLTWPYTIFIAPVALILAALRKDDRIPASA